MNNITYLKNSFPILLIFCIILGCSSQEEKSKDLKEISFRLPIPIVDAAFAPFYIAQDKGFFAKHGLKVKLEPGSAELNPTKMVAQGSDEFGVVGGPELLMTARDKGVPLVGFALLHKDSNFVVILTKRDSKLTKLSDLRDKKVGFFYGHISTDVLRYLFNKDNVNIKEVDVGFDYSQFIAGKIEAQWAFRTTAGITLPAKGVEVNEISPAEYGVVTQGYTLFTTENIIKNEPGLVKDFLSAIIEATEYSINNREDSIEATLKRDKNFKRDIAEKQLVVYEKVIKGNDKIGWIDMQSMEDTKNRLESQNILSSGLDFYHSFNTKFVEEYYSVSVE